MDTRFNESVGFLCRWGLLVLAGAVIVWAAWAAVAATAAVTADLEASVILPDTVWGAGGKIMYATGFLSASMRRSAAPLGLYQDQSGRLCFARGLEERKMRTYLPTLPPGSHTLTVRGLPYSPIAFQQYQARLMVIPDATEVYMVDARLAAEGLRSNSIAMERIMAELDRLGQPVFYCPSLPERLVRLRESLTKFPNVPLLCVLDRHGRADLTTTLRNVTRHKLRRSNRKPFVITGDAEMARLAAERGFYTHVVAPEGYIPNVPNPRAYKSLSGLASHLAKEPSP